MDGDPHQCPYCRISCPFPDTFIRNTVRKIHTKIAFTSSTMKPLVLEMNGQIHPLHGGGNRLVPEQKTNITRQTTPEVFVNREIMDAVLSSYLFDTYLHI